MAFLSLAIITVIILLFLPEKEAVGERPSKPSIVVMPFNNNSGDEHLEHLRFALSDMLITDLSQSKHVFVFRRDRIFSTLIQTDLLKAQSFSSKDLRSVAMNLMATHLIQGSFIKLGDVFRIDIDVKDVRSLESMGVDKVEGDESSLSSMIDELTRKVKSHLKLTDEAIAHDIDERVGDVTTSSQTAYEYYIEGRNHHNFNDYEKSIESMEEALKIDPEFALAYKSISESYNSMGLLSKGRDYAKKALEFSDRITDRERFNLQLHFYRTSEMTWDKALKAGSMLIQLYPDDIGGNNLAMLYFLLEQWDKAIEHSQVFVDNQEITYYPYMGIVASYEAKGMYDKAARILESYLHDISEHHSIRWQLAFLYLCQGKYNQALDEAKKLDPWNSDIKGNIYHCLGELDKAEREYLNMLDSRISRDVLAAKRLLGSLYLLQGRYDEATEQLTQGVEFCNVVGEPSWKHEIHSELAYLYLATGNLEKALEQCNKAFLFASEEESVRRQIESLHLRGLIFSRMNRLDEAQRTADKLRDLVENWLNRKLIRYYLHLIGQIELEKRNFPKAIAHFKNAITFLPFQHYEWYYRLPAAHALLLESLASGYFQSGEFALAQKEYEKIVNLTVGKLWYGDIHARCLYMLARIFEQQGQRELAHQHYQKFLALIKDADSGLREADDAKKRMAVLKNQ